MSNPRKPLASSPSAPAPSAALGTWLGVVQAYHLCESLMAQRLAALGVKTAEHEILANLLREPGLTQRALGERCFTAKSHVSTLLDALQARGWVRREPNPADARSKLLFLTRAGERMATRTAAVQSEVIAGMCEGESNAALLEVRAAMGRVADRLKGMLGAA
jgi:DNA-binding MarR family transcriptional regulator